MKNESRENKYRLCKEAIEKTIDDNFDGTHLNKDAAKSVIENFGLKCVAQILVFTIRQKDYDGRISWNNKTWARSIYPNTKIPKNCVINTHPAVLDGFINSVRKETDDKNLKEFLDICGVDDIEDDEEFMEAEFDAALDWGLKHFNLSEEDIQELESRGIREAFEETQEETPF